ncbi:hypothetical protein HYU92_02420 [Candidatus Curtissbacteria bacterium]|nr:hypothetical protein [Candidatus Curtissbacteria bacterium]
MERMPGSEADWVRRREGNKTLLETTQVDPTTGVTTTWRKDLRYFTESRTDQLPNNPLYRYISRRSRPVQGEVSYSIGFHHGGLHKSINLSEDDLGLPELEMHVADEAETNHFFATYNGNNLSRIRVHHNSLDLHSTYQEILQHPLRENIQELAQLCRTEGVVAAFNPEMGIFHDVVDTTQEAYLQFAKNHRRDKINEAMRNWSDEEKGRAMHDVTIVVEGMTRQALLNFYDREEMTPIISELTELVIAELPFDYYSKERLQRSLLINDALKHRVAWILTANRDKHERLSDFTANFHLDQNPEGVIQVEIEDSQQEVIHRGQFRLGGKFRYEDYDYQILKAGENSMSASVTGILKREHELHIIVPARIDLQEFSTLIKTAESSGWERALEVADINYSKT